jgi:NAD(P)-dependent dehydrogenase (short-subunit alcohol dehydrogenase family)
MRLLENKVALVTGGGSGIGRSVALSYAAEGARVVISDVDESGGGETAKLIKENSGEALFIKADSSKPSENEALVRRAIEKYGALHIACNNAGIGGPSFPVGEYPIDGWDRVIAINLSGVFYGMRYEIPAILSSGGGAIVNMASILAQVGFRNAAAYVSAKHGLVGLTQNAALEYAARNIRINAVGPGFIMTPLLAKNLDEDAIRNVAALHPIGRLGDPEEVAELVLWLSSPKASFVTGAYYAIDGGYLAQ